jgi:hypothetical protein
MKRDKNRPLKLTRLDRPTGSGNGFGRTPKTLIVGRSDT